MRWHLVWLLGTFALSGCGADGHLPTEMVNAPVPFASAPERPKPSEKATVRKIELSKEQKKAVEQAVTRKLKDPGSAKFRNLVASASTTGATAVCGLVNAKDSTGGYVGERAFMGSFDASQLAT